VGEREEREEGEWSGEVDDTGDEAEDVEGKEKGNGNGKGKGKGKGRGEGGRNRRRRPHGGGRQCSPSLVPSPSRRVVLSFSLPYNSQEP
jgi:hypothetical protein